jgi:hypothetical protein
MLKAWYTLPILLPLYLWRVNWGGLPTNVLELAVGALFLGTLLEYRANLRSLKPTKREGVVLGLLGVAVAGGVWVAPDQLSALGYAKAYFVIPALVFWGVKLSSGEDVSLSYLWRVLAGVAGLLTLVGVIQLVTGQGLPAPWDYDVRATSVFPYPNALGLFLAPVASALLAYGVRTRQVWAGMGFLVSVIGIGIAETEAGLVAVGVTTGIVLLSDSGLKKWRPFLLAGGGVLLGIALLLTPIREKLLLQDYSGLVRRSQWVETVELLKDNPLFGAGLGGYPTVFIPYHQATDYEIFQYPHNIFLNQWVELGLLGLILLLWFLGVFGQSLWMDVGGETWPAKMAILTMVIHGLVDVPFYKNDLAVLTVLLLAVIFGCKKGHAELPRPVRSK